MGSYSGIDKATIDKLMQVEKLPLNQLTSKKTDITAKQNAWKDVNTRLNSLFNAISALQSKDLYTSMVSKSSSDDVATISASENAAVGTYKINVEQLATNTNIIGDKVGTIKSGSFFIKNHDADIAQRKVEVSSTDTIQDIANKINLLSKDSEDGTEKGTGIVASVIDNRLVLTDEATGQRTITLTNEDAGVDVVGSLGLKSATEIEKLGKNARFTINGVLVDDRTTNSIDDIVEGLTFNLKKEGASTVTVSKDTEKLTKAVQAFVDQYNSTMTFIEEKLAAGTVTEEGNKGRGILAGDSSLQRLQSTLRQMVTSQISNDDTEIKDVSLLGVTSKDRYGKLVFDSSKLLEQLKKNPDNIKNFFSSKAEGADGKEIEIGFVSRLNQQINSFISSDKGIIKSKNESFDRTLRDLNKQIDRFNDRMIRKEEYYTKMFSALDVAMMQAESQMEWLNGQISAMNGQSSKK